jgi:hypothetical protein
MKKIFALALFIPIILQAQNVGIGTTAPNRLLHLKGTAELLRIQGNTPWIGFMNNTDPDYGGFLYYPDTSLVMGSRFGTNLPLVIAPNNNGLLFATASQRVGIGNPAPSEKLDVAGNINVTGTIKANGVDGTANQVLMKNGSGILAWGDMCEFKNFVSFTTGSFATWDIPVSTKKIWVELWGGGASGSPYAGGGGGGYVSALLEITNPLLPGQITYTVGAAGMGGNGANGSASNVFYSTITLQANGGMGATFAAGPPQVVSGNFGGDGYALPASFTSFIYKRGSPGQPYSSTIQTIPTTVFETVTTGRGGNAGNTDNTGGLPNQAVYNLTSSTTIRYNNAAGNGIVPGGGGGSGFASITGGLVSSFGSNGASGMIIIHY